MNTHRTTARCAPRRDAVVFAGRRGILTPRQDSSSASASRADSEGRPGRVSYRPSNTAYSATPDSSPSLNSARDEDREALHEMASSTRHRAAPGDVGSTLEVTARDAAPRDPHARSSGARAGRETGRGLPAGDDALLAPEINVDNNTVEVDDSEPATFGGEFSGDRMETSSRPRTSSRALHVLPQVPRRDRSVRAQGAAPDRPVPRDPRDGRASLPLSQIADKLFCGQCPRRTPVKIATGARRRVLGELRSSVCTLSRASRPRTSTGST